MKAKEFECTGDSRDTVSFTPMKNNEMQVLTVTQHFEGDDPLHSAVYVDAEEWAEFIKSENQRLFGGDES